MSPTSKEVISNKPLAGEELKTVLRADFERLLTAEGLLSSHIAFGRVSYMLELRLHTGNIHFPVSPTRVYSAHVPQPTDPALAALEAPPLTPAPAISDQVLSSHTLTREVTSPNIERIRHALPVEVRHQAQDGSIERNKIIYPRNPDTIPEAEGPGNVSIADTTDAARHEWPVVDAPLDLSVLTDAQQIAAAEDEGMRDLENVSAIQGVNNSATANESENAKDADVT